MYRDMILSYIPASIYHVHIIIIIFIYLPSDIISQEKKLQQVTSYHKKTA